MLLDMKPGILLALMQALMHYCLGFKLLLNRIPKTIGFCLIGIYTSISL